MGQPDIKGKHFQCQTIVWEDGKIDSGMACLKTQVARLALALGFYADFYNHSQEQIAGGSEYPSAVMVDGGALARRILDETGNEW